MKEVILSHDSEAVIYRVPDIVAENLNKYCWEFAAEWIWKSPDAQKYHHFSESGVEYVQFGAPDFIDWLNTYAFPQQRSERVRGLGCWDYEIPAAYDAWPRYNF